MENEDKSLVIFTKQSLREAVIEVMRDEYMDYEGQIKEVEQEMKFKTASYNEEKERYIENLTDMKISSMNALTRFARRLGITLYGKDLDEVYEDGLSED